MLGNLMDMMFLWLYVRNFNKKYVHEDAGEDIGWTGLARTYSLAWGLNEFFN